MGRTFSKYGERRGAYKVLERKSEVRKQHGRARRRWEDNIKMDLKDLGWGHRQEVVIAGISFCRNKSAGALS
jgi:hypothetical protein